MLFASLRSRLLLKIYCPHIIFVVGFKKHYPLPPPPSPLLPIVSSLSRQCLPLQLVCLCSHPVTTVLCVCVCVCVCVVWYVCVVCACVCVVHVLCVCVV